MIYFKGQSTTGELRNPEKCSSNIALDMEAAESFIQQAMEIIFQEAVKKATDVKEKVNQSPSCSSVVFTGCVHRLYFPYIKYIQNLQIVVI